MRKVRRVNSPVFNIERYEECRVCNHLQTLKVLRGEGKVTVFTKSWCVVEICHHFLVWENWIVFWTFLMKKCPVLPWLSGQWDIIRFEICAVEEYRSEHGVLPVAPVVGEEAPVVPTGLKTIITCERCPPQHHWDVTMFGRSWPSSGNLKMKNTLCTMFNKILNEALLIQIW